MQAVVELLEIDNASDRATFTEPKHRLNSIEIIFVNLKASIILPVMDLSRSTFYFE